MVFRILLICLFFTIRISEFLAQGCHCPPLPEANAEYFAQYDLIFNGRVDSVSPCNGRSQAHFSIQELFRGKSPRHIKVEFECSGPCYMSFEKGEIWLIYARYIRYGTPGTSFCSRSRKFFSKANEDYYLPASGMTFEEETGHLRELAGGGEILAGNSTSQDAKRELLKPGRKNAWLLMGVSLFVLALIFYLVKRFLK